LSKGVCREHPRGREVEVTYPDAYRSFLNDPDISLLLTFSTFADVSRVGGGAIPVPVATPQWFAR